jgi:hypothetical protein
MRASPLLFDSFLPPHNNANDVLPDLPPFTFFRRFQLTASARMTRLFSLSTAKLNHLLDDLNFAAARTFCDQTHGGCVHLQVCVDHKRMTFAEIGKFLGRSEASKIKKQYSKAGRTNHKTDEIGRALKSGA